MRWRLLFAMVFTVLLSVTTLTSATASTPSSVSAAPSNISFVQADSTDDYTCTFWGVCYGDRDIWSNPTGCDIWGNCYGDRNVWGTPLNQCDIWGNCYGNRDIWGNPIEQCSIWGCTNSGNSNWWYGTGDKQPSSPYWNGGTGWGNTSGCEFYGTCDNFGW